MIKRTLTGAVILVFVYTWLFFSHIPAVLHIGIVILGFLAAFEILRICKPHSKKERWITLLFSAALLVLPIPKYEYFMLLIFFVAVILFAVMMAMKDNIKEFNIKIAAAVSITVVLLFKAIPELRERDNGFYYLTFAVTACFVTDVAAFLFGKAFGKRRLCPRISPNKTVEGAFGGVVCTMLVIAIVTNFLGKYGLMHFNTAALIIWSVLISIIGQFGDLCMSAVKRIAGVKDFGRLLPGHGGILDRFDSHVFAVAFTLVFCVLGGEFIR